MVLAIELKVRRQDEETECCYVCCSVCVVCAAARVLSRVLWSINLVYVLICGASFLLLLLYAFPSSSSSYLFSCSINKMKDIHDQWESEQFQFGEGSRNVPVLQLVPMKVKPFTQIVHSVVYSV